MFLNTRRRVSLPDREEFQSLANSGFYCSSGIVSVIFRLANAYIVSIWS